MIKLSSIIQRGDSSFKRALRHRIFHNFISLSALQGASILIPLITVPFLIRVIGIEKFGVLGMALALVMYFELITDYGFDLSATRRISQNRNDPYQLQMIYNSVLVLKTGLCIISFIIFSLIVWALPVFREYSLIYFLTFGRVIGKCLFPVWFYQGMEQMKFITRFNLTAKIFFSALIFVLIQKPEDYFMVPVLNALGAIVPALYTPIHLFKKFGLRWSTPNRIHLFEGLNDGFYIFLSRVYVNLYHSFNTLILGFFTNYQTVGHYTVAAKVIEAFSMVFIPANNALFPHLSKLWEENTQRFYTLIDRLKKIYLIAGSAMSLAVLILAHPLLKIISGETEESAVVLLRLLAIKLPFIALGPLFTSMFISQGRNKDYLWVVKNTFLVNLLIIPVAIHFYGAEGLAVAVLVVAGFHQILFYRKRMEFTVQDLSAPITSQP